MQNKFYLTEKLPPYIFAAMYKLKTEAAAKGLEIIDYHKKNNDATIIFNEVREDERTINRVSKYLETQNKAAAPLRAVAIANALKKV